MRRINPNLYPSGGFFFKERDGAIIRGSSWRGVIRAVEIYRKRAGYPLENIEAEVMAQACERNSSLCYENTASYNTALRKASLKSRVLKWLTEVIRREKSFVDGSVRKAREDICLKCPLHQQIPAGCTACGNAVNELRKVILTGRGIDQRLHHCDVLGEDTAVSTALDLIRVNSSELPNFCWRKAI